MPHINEKIDFTVSVFIVHHNAVLLRLHEKYGVWTGPGGHIERDEDPHQAAIRETKEETGLTIELFDAGGAVSVNGTFTKGHLRYTELPLPAFLNRHHTSETHEHIDLVYLAKTNSAALAPATNEKETPMKWFKEKDLDDPQYGLEPHVKYYARKALETLS